MLQVNDVLQTVEEPDVNLCQFLDALHGVPLFQCLGDGKDAQVCRILQGIVQVLKARVVVAHKAVHALANHAKTFLNHLFKRAADRHNLAHRFHGRTYLTGNTGKLRQVPARNLTDHVVKAGSYVG